MHMDASRKVSIWKMLLQLFQSMAIQVLSSPGSRNHGRRALWSTSQQEIDGDHSKVAQMKLQGRIIGNPLVRSWADPVVLAARTLISAGERNAHLLC